MGKTPSLYVLYLYKRQYLIRFPFNSSYYFCSWKK